jgi:ParB-like chromosome segregation protein Spo0J
MAEKLKIQYIKVDQLKPLEGNPRRRTDPDAIDRLGILIREHGFQNPLQVFKNGDAYEIICGNHRFEAGIKQQMKEFPAIVYEGSRNKALARAISDNRSADWTEWDYPSLKDMVADLDTGDFGIELTGFNQKELTDLFEGGDKDDDSPDDFDDLDEDIDTEHQCPKCGYEWSGVIK